MTTGIEYILEIHGMSCSELSRKLNIERQNVNRWMKGKRPIPKKYLPILSDIFNIPVEYLSKELTEEDKIYIQKLKVRNEVKNNREEKDDMVSVNVKKEINYDLLSEEEIFALAEQEEKEQFERLDRALKFLENKSVLIDVYGGNGVNTYQYYENLKYEYITNSSDGFLLNLENDDEEVNCITIEINDISSIEFEDGIDEETGELYEGLTEYYCEVIWINLYNGQGLRIEYQW